LSPSLALGGTNTESKLKARLEEAVRMRTTIA